MYENEIIFSSLLYSVWAFYFSRQILKEKFSPLKTYLLILLTHVVLIIGGRRIFPNGVPVILVHLSSIISIAAFHYGSIKKKFLTYFLYSSAVMLMEMLVMCLYVSVQRIFFHSAKGLISMNSVTSPVDMVILCTIMLTAGTVMLKLIADLTGTFSRYYSITPLAQIFFPFYWFCIILSLLCNYQLKFNFYSVLFLALSIPVIPIFLRGMRNIRIQEKNRIFREKQIELLKEQLEFFNDMETEYQNLRKWNHDIENHLLSMNYLMKNGRYEEADKYLHNISR